MLRKALIIFLMGMVLIGAAATGTSFPILLLIGILIVIALAESAAHNEQQE